MAKKHSHKKPGMTIPLAVVAGLAVPTITMINSAGDWQNKLNGMFAWLTGYNPNTGHWNVTPMRYGAMPIALGFIAHKIAGKLGVNRAIAAAGIPFVRI